MEEFDSELHTLCEQARWAEVAALVALYIESIAARDAAVVDSPSKKEDEDGSSLSPSYLDTKAVKHHGASSFAPRSNTSATENQTSDICSSTVSGSYVDELRYSYGGIQKHEGSGSMGTDTIQIPTAQMSDQNGSEESISSSNRAGEEDSVSSIHNTRPPTPPPDKFDDDVMSQGRIDLLKSQLISRVGPRRWTPLMIACVDAPVQVISLLLRACPEACGIPDRSGNLPLHIASKWRSSKLVVDESLTEDVDDSPYELPLVLYMLMVAHPESVATMNRWKQTPLHSLFESKHPVLPSHIPTCKGSGTQLAAVETMLGRWDNEVYRIFDEHTCVEDVTEVKQLVEYATNCGLRVHDGNGRLPLHCAALCQWVDLSIIRVLIQAYPPSTWTPVLPTSECDEDSASSSYSWDVNRDSVATDGNIYSTEGGYHGRDLAVHLFHKRCMLPAELSGHSASEDELWSKSHVTNASAFLSADFHCEAISLLLTPMVDAALHAINEARSACSASGVPLEDESSSSSIVLPIHVACIHGVSFDLLEKLCRVYPVSIQIPLTSMVHPDRMGMLPIELFEEGRAGHEVNNASDASFPQLSTAYFKRSDLLFSHFTEARALNGIFYYQDAARMSRFVDQIQREINESPHHLISDTAGAVWMMFCRNYTKTRRKGFPNFGTLVGRVLEGLDESVTPRLNVIKTESAPGGISLCKLANGRTVKEEAMARAPSGSLEHILDGGEIRIFHRHVLSFLSGRDALSYSATCLKAWAYGARSLRKIKENGIIDCHGSFDCDDFKAEDGQTLSMKWQDFTIPCVQKCTHSVMVSADISYRGWTEMDSSACSGGGIRIVGSDGKLCGRTPPLKSKGGPGAQKAFPVAVIFNHVPNREYSFHCYGSTKHTLTVSNIKVRQVVFTSDRNGLNPLHALLSEGNNSSANLRDQIICLMTSGFGQDLPIHYALNAGVEERVLRCLIETNPAALLDTDSEGRTALHSAFDTRKIPNLSCIQALMMHSGLHALHLKDSRGRLPIHIASASGAPSSVLALLVESYADSCYRRTDKGDLPLHLLVRSGSANQVAVEILLTPIMHSSSVCTFEGSVGVNLPLHIAAEFRVKYAILEALVTAYSEGCKTRRQLMKENKEIKEKCRPEYPLDIFETGRRAEGFTKDPDVESDFDRRSDLLFVYNPDVAKASTANRYVQSYYRDDKMRIDRLSSKIKTEAVQCKLSVVSTLAWCWMCSNDSNLDAVSSILSSLPIEAVRYLTQIENPNSQPTRGMPMKDCSTQRVNVIFKTSLSFLGRYAFVDASPLYQSDSTLVLRAKDLGAVDTFLTITKLLDDTEVDIDDYSHDCGSVYAIKSNSIEISTFELFVDRLGLNKGIAISEIESLILDPQEKDVERAPDLKELGVKSSAFKDFCRLHNVQDDGTRDVAIKFMKNVYSFEVERQARDVLTEVSSTSGFVPILHDFSLDEESVRLADELHTGSMSLLDYKCGFIMPCADASLVECLARGDLDSSQIRGISKHMAETLRGIHEQGLAFNNLQLKNILLVGGKTFASDLGSSSFVKSFDGLHALGGTRCRLSPSILPPEMIARISLTEGNSMKRVLDYWAHVKRDADALCVLTPSEREAVSDYVRRSSAGNADWRGEISTLFETIMFHDLPPVISSIATLPDFCLIWARLQENLSLWEVIRPRVDKKNKCAYMVKFYENRDDSPALDVSVLPYQVKPPSESVDIWTWGCFFYELISRGTLWHTSFNGNLLGVRTFSALHNWDTSSAKDIINEHVQDPLAKDLLYSILAPSNQRAPSMAAILDHPYFSPESVDAERYLERHEELQILEENTCHINRVSTSMATLFEESMEHYCKFAFGVEPVFPTCFVALPYALKWNKSSQRMEAPPYASILLQAEKMGVALLEINKATARLSFWARMNKRMSGPNNNAFKMQLQGWLKRARNESCSLIAAEIIEELGIERNYVMIVEEVLSLDGSQSKARTYMRDPLRAAKKAVRQNTSELIKLFDDQCYVYLVDEATMLPMCPPQQLSAYPFILEPNSKLIMNVLMPFINIAVMKALAKDKFVGLLKLLGIEGMRSVPSAWPKTEPVLLHNTGTRAMIEEIVSLQQVLRKEDLSAYQDDVSVSSFSVMSDAISVSNRSTFSVSALGLAHIDLAPLDPRIASLPVTQMELIFREYDPDRQFASLCRVTAGTKEQQEGTGSGMWTTYVTIQDMISMEEFSQIEDSLNDLRQGKNDQAAAEKTFTHLMSRRQQVLKTLATVVSPAGLELFGVDVPTTTADSQLDGEAAGSGPTDAADPGQSAAQSSRGRFKLLGRGKRTGKVRKSKKKFRPWFTAC